MKDNNIEQIGKILQSTVERQILEPRFAAFNRSWKEGAGKTIPEKVGMVTAALEKVEWQDPEIPQLAAELKRMAGVAVALHFSPPANFHWWQSAATKASTIETMEESTLKELALDRAQEQAQQLLKALDVVVKQETLLLDDVQHRIQAAEESFKQQEAKLASLGKAFEFLSLDFVLVASRFPLLLGLLLGAGAIWLAQRWRNVVDAYLGMPGHEIADLPQPLLFGSRHTRTGPDRSWWIAGLIVFVSLLWIWVSVWQLSGWSQVSLGQLIFSGMVGSALATLGVLYCTTAMKPVHG